MSYLLSHVIVPEWNLVSLRFCHKPSFHRCGSATKMCTCREFFTDPCFVASPPPQPAGCLLCHDHCMIFTCHKVNSSYTCPVGAASCTVILCLPVCVCVRACRGEGQLREGGYSPRPEPTAASASGQLQPGRAAPWLQKRHHRSLSGVSGALSTNPRDERLDNFCERHSRVSFIHHPAQLSGMSPPPPTHPPTHLPERFDCHMYACFWKVCLCIAAALRVTVCPEALCA